MISHRIHSQENGNGLGKSHINEIEYYAANKISVYNN